MSDDQRTFKEKNKIFSVWIRINSLNWFLDFLKKVSHGETDSERFRQYLYDLQEKDLKGELSIKPQPPKPKPLIRKLTDEEKENFCLRRKIDKFTSKDRKERICDMCKVRDRPTYEACQEIKKTQTAETLQAYMKRGARP